VVHGKGFMFTGDFCHAGVTNIADGTEESKMMEELNTKMMQIEVSKKMASTKFKEKLKVLCEFQGLRKLCRLHCTTQGKPEWCKVIIPTNSVGFHGCLMNPPDNTSPTKFVIGKSNNDKASRGHRVEGMVGTDETVRSSFKRLHGDGVTDNDDGTDTRKVLKSTHFSGEHHNIPCPVCSEEILIASHITLPYWRSIKSANSEFNEMERQESESRQVIREHCKKAGHHMLWEVAKREDYVTNEEFCKNPITEGGAWMLVHTFLSESFFPCLSDLQSNGELGLLMALVEWKTAIKSKGM
jgi:hypothetical protein